MGRHVYERMGNYTVSVKAVDRYGLESEFATVTIEVRNVPPVANLTGEGMLFEDQAVNLSAWNSSDTPSDVPNLTLAWDFGDHTTVGPAPSPRS